MEEMNQTMEIKIHTKLLYPACHGEASHMKTMNLAESSSSLLYPGRSAETKIENRLSCVMSGASLTRVARAQDICMQNSEARNAEH
ncbi:hypothetical protein E2C01_042693 [Portunus trituberculatus]|uniref:Uncharacterized protein n=1 Tax=Portunus trituberculatus TaxID=210409 RepID=A0A5B7FU30_PORTR|nr:hypothetical protein [Portunus trituberculatus]